MAHNGGVINRRAVLALLAPVSTLAVRRPIFLFGAVGADMGRLSEWFWGEQQANEFALTKDEALGWLRGVSRWSIREASSLLAGDKPRLYGELSEMAEYFSKLLNAEIIDETPDREKNKVFSLCGFKAKVVGVYDAFYAHDFLQFPVQAYFAFSMDKLFPNVAEGCDLPCFGIFHDLDKESGQSDLIEPVDHEFGGVLRSLGLHHPLIMSENGGESATELVEETIIAAPLEQIIFEGLSVADVRKMCERSGALASVLRVVAQWQAIEKENPERMTTDVLLSKLKIAARKDGWGTDKGELAEKSQAEPLRKMILGEWRPGGRPRKDSNN